MAAEPGGAEPPLAYEEVTEDSYAEHATGFDIDTTPDDTIVLHGTCPRCRHVMEYVISDSVTKRAAEAVTTTAPAQDGQPSVEEMCCTCDQEHPGRPADYLGCGAFWDLALHDS
jgi:hypothetical protein